jgi:hypothetical protein
LSLKLGEKVMEVLQRCSRLRESGDNGCDIMSTLEELIVQVEDIEALISALDGLMRDMDDEKISDPAHVRRYLGYCLHLRRRGRMDVKMGFADADGDGSEGAEEESPATDVGSCAGRATCRLRKDAPGGRCSCTGIERKKELARIIGAAVRERGG